MLSTGEPPVRGGGHHALAHQDHLALGARRCARLAWDNPEKPPFNWQEGDYTHVRSIGLGLCRLRRRSPQLETVPAKGRHNPEVGIVQMHKSVFRAGMPRL